MSDTPLFRVLSAIPNPKVKGVGFILREGKPVISDDFIRNLSDEEIAGLNRALALHGFVIRDRKLLED